MLKENNESGRLTEQAFSRLIIALALGILLSIALLCSTTYAWFSGGVSGDGNVIMTSGAPELAVTLTQNGMEIEGIEEGVTLLGEYTVTLTLPSGSASGYCVIEAGGVSYRTEYIRHHEDGEPRTVSFTLIVESEQTVTFVKRWGIYSSASDLSNSVLVIS